MTNSMKEMAIREYISNIDFNIDDWRISKIEEDLKKLLGEIPGLEISYKKDVMINEVMGTSEEIKSVEKVSIVFTDLDDKFKKLEFLID